MKAKNIFLLDYMSQPYKFVIPVYQRNYNWTIKQCKELIDDLKEIRNNNKTHFFGNIVSVLDTTDTQLSIVDGQQRLATMSLILIALRRAIKYKKILCETPGLTDEIWEKYLSINSEKLVLKSGSKFVPFKNDHDNYMRIFSGNQAEDSNIAHNFNYIFSEITNGNNGFTAENLIDAISRLEIVDIRLEQEDRPQEIFESLNATGLELNESDKIRNFLLMSCDPEIQEIVYDDYWAEIENNTKHETDEFIRMFLCIRADEPRLARSDIYPKFKEYTKAMKRQNGQKMLDAMLEDMKEFSLYYNDLVQSNTGNEVCDRILNNIKTINGFESALPFLLTVYSYVKKRMLNFDDLIDILKTTDNYFIKTTICRTKSGAKSLFPLVNEKIKNYSYRKDEALKDYAEKYKYVLLNDFGNSVIPDNNVFKDEFKTVNFYSMKPVLMRIFDEIENFEENEKHDIYGSSYTIEHIMPQNKSNTWAIYIGRNYDELMKNYKDTIGNLTLSKHCAELGNSSFSAKKNTEYKGYVYDELRINQYFNDVSSWKREDIERRAADLSDKAIQIWPNIISVYKPQIKKSFITLEDVDIDFKSLKPKSIKVGYRGNAIEADSWKKIFVEFCKLVASNDFNRFAVMTKNPNFIEFFPKYGEELFKNIYIKKITSAQNVIETMRKICSELGIRKSDVIINLQNNELEIYDIKHQTSQEKRMFLNQGCTDILNEKRGYGHIEKITFEGKIEMVYVHYYNDDTRLKIIKSSIEELDSYEVLEKRV